MNGFSNSQFGGANGTTTRESHRVYYFDTEKNSMTSAAIRLCHDIPCCQVLCLLKQKFGLPLSKKDVIAAKLGQLKLKDSLLLVATSTQHIHVPFPHTTTTTANNNHDETATSISNNMNALNSSSINHQNVDKFDCVPLQFFGNTPQTIAKPANRKKDSGVTPPSIHHSESSIEQGKVDEEEVLVEKKEPFHIVKTVPYQDSPLKTRQEMQSYLSNQGISNPSITLRWFFLPQTQKQQQQQQHIPLDGYCTTVDHDSDNDDDEQDDDTFLPTESLSMDEVIVKEWKQKRKQKHEIFYDQHEIDSMDTNKQDEMNKVRRKNNKKKNWRREQQLAHLVALSNQEPNDVLLTGYLLRQSQVDNNVWKRVYVIINNTNFQLWIIGRVRNTHQSIGQINYLSLHHATLIQHSSGDLEIMTPQSSWKFRVSDVKEYQQWFEAFKLVIQQAQESHVLEMADLLIEEESFARSKRISHDWFLSGENKYWKLGWYIMEYKETCRHVQHYVQSTTATNPVVISSAALPQRSKKPYSHRLKKQLPIEKEKSNNNHLSTEQLESIQHAWTVARQIWKYSHQLNSTEIFQKEQQKIQIVLEKDMPPPLLLLNNNNNNKNNKNQNHPNISIPPMDLFNNLLQSCIETSFRLPEQTK